MINTNTERHRSGRSHNSNSRHNYDWEYRDCDNDRHHGSRDHHHRHDRRHDRHDNYRDYDYGYRDTGWGGYRHATRYPYAGYGGGYGGTTINLGAIAGSVINQLASDLAAPVNVATGKMTAGQALENFVRGPSKVLGETAQALTGSYRSNTARYPTQRYATRAPHAGDRVVDGDFAADGGFRDRYGAGSQGTSHHHQRADQRAAVYYQGPRNTYYNSPSLDEVANGQAVMKLRDGGEPVAQVQKLLNLVSGKELLTPDGLYGDSTKNAVKDFQKWLIQQGELPRGSANGVVDQRTLQALVTLARNQAPEQG